MKHISPILFVAIILLSLCLTGCYRPYTPIVYQTLDTTLTSGRLEYYGTYYEAEGVDYDVVCLDLYSKGLGLNHEGMMEGVGTNLYIGDIFVPAGTLTADRAESVLPAGRYESDSVAQLMHFLRGLDYDGNYGGSYVLLMGESGYSVLPVTVAEMTVAYIGDTLVLDGKAELRDQRKPYTFHYRDVLPTINRER